MDFSSAIVEISLVYGYKLSNLFHRLRASLSSEESAARTVITVTKYPVVVLESAPITTPPSYSTAIMVVYKQNTNSACIKYIL